MNGPGDLPAILLTIRDPISESSANRLLAPPMEHRTRPVRTAPDRELGTPRARILREKLNLLVRLVEHYLLIAIQLAQGDIQIRRVHGRGYS
jgi:hypothetical protein